jgi:hypothetical protein
MKSSLRPTSINDLNGVRHFLQRVFNTSHDSPFLEPSVMAWKYWDRRDDWEGPRSYVLERNDVIVAHVGIYPLTFGTGELRGIHMIDWASARDCPGAGIALVRELSTMFDFIYAIGGSEMTRKVLPAFGFVEYTRQWRGARPLRPFQQILKHQFRNWKLAPRLVRNTLWALSNATESGTAAGWKSKEIGSGDVSPRFHSQSAADAHFSPRQPAFFEYLLRCPVMQIRLYDIHDKTGSRGHFALGVLRGQARLAGVWLDDLSEETWQAAFSLAQQAARRLDGANEVAAAGTEGRSELAAGRTGLRIMSYAPVYLLNKNGKLALPPDFQFQLVDNDGFFLDSGRSTYWT